MKLLALFETEDHRFYDLQIPPPGDPTIAAWLEQTFRDEDAYGGHVGDGNTASTLAGGGDWAICTSWAQMVIAAMPGRGRVMGFMVDDNPDAKRLARVCDGHDFAVVDNRYIVDGWAKNVEGLTDKVVFDMQNSRDKQMILGMYGQPSTWTAV